MEIIKTLEIGYFRSIYKAELKTLSDMNIIFGKNDSGKSNIIRALNLFFNDETNIGKRFEFESDLCHARLAESKKLADARKFVYVKIVFKVPDTWVKSLGKEFYVKKSWSITTGEIFNIETSIKDKKKSTYVTRFLGSIKFRYIPAIKDRSIFSNLLAELYNTLSTNSDFNKSLDSFSEELQKKTTELQSDLFKNINYDSKIAPPTDLTSLFKALDFDTTCATGEKYSLTNQHGDGIQVRHIPSILSYLSKNGKESFNIWGFEEPENSLELSAAIDESRRLLEIASGKNIQLFITSHSPAFYSLEADNVRKIYAQKEEYETTKRMVTELQNVNKKEDIAKLIGDKALIISISKAMDEYIALEKSNLELEKKLKNKKLPKLFVEGASDKIIIDAIAKKLYKNRVPFEVIEGNGTTKMHGLTQPGKVIQTIFDKKLFVLVDNDTEGREFYKSARLGDGGKWVQDNSNKSYFCKLPFSSELKRVFTNSDIDKAYWPGTIENIIPAEDRYKAITLGKYLIKDEVYADVTQNPAAVNKAIKILTSETDKIYQVYLHPIHHDFKEVFAKHVADEIGKNRLILEDIENIVKEMTNIITINEES